MKSLRLGDLSLPWDAQPETQTFGILAKRGAGKTYTASVIAEEMLKAHRQIVVADPIGVWHGLRSSADGRKSGLPIYVFGGESKVRDLPLEVGAGELIADVVVDQRVSVVLDLSLFRKGEQVRFMTDFSERLYHKNRSALHLFLDEADAFAPQKPPKGAERMLGAVEDLVRRGRARGIGVTLITQRSAVLNKDVLTQIEVLVTLRTISPQDRHAIDGWIIVHGTDEQRATLMQSLPSLPVGTAWFWSPGWPTADGIFQRVRVRKRETFDSSATPKSGERRVVPRVFADVDLDALKAKMSATIERAKQDDPKALRVEIATLKKQLASGAVAAPKAVQKIVRVAPIITKSDARDLRKRMEKLTKQLDLLGFSVVAMDIQGNTTRAMQHDTTLAIHALETKISAALNPASIPRASASSPDRHATPRPVEAPRAKHRPIVGSDGGPGARGIGSGERRVLAAIAQRDNASRSEITLLTGLKIKSVATYIQRLRQRGYLSESNGHLRASEDGVSALGADYEPLPTGDELRAYWLAKLPKGESEILRLLVDAHPHKVGRDTIAERTSYTPASVNTYVQRLSARKLVVAGREVSASEELFS